jgi:hypothetical protein
MGIPRNARPDPGPASILSVEPPAPGAPRPKSSPVPTSLMEPLPHQQSDPDPSPDDDPSKNIVGNIEIRVDDN